MPDSLKIALLEMEPERYKVFTRICSLLALEHWLPAEAEYLKTMIDRSTELNPYILAKTKP